MTNRRQFIQAGLAASTLPLSGFVSAVSAEQEILKLDHFVFDDRFNESINVAKAIHQSGVLKHGISDDLTKLWYHFLQVDLQQGPKNIAGITSKEALFFLERLAWTHDLRIIYRGKHNTPAKGKVNHEIKGPESMVRNITSSTNESWTHALAFSLQQCERAFLNQTKHTQLNDSKCTSERDVDLVSWLMVPTQARAIS